ncbi:MAG: hypothetical protein AAB647_01730 [Patescibacteria group bacterium]
MSIFDELLITIDDQQSLNTETLNGFFPNVSRQQLSSTIGRLIGRGWLATPKLNGQEKYQLTKEGNAYINAVLGVIRVREEPWSGEWFWLVASLPESKRRERDLLRIELNRQGFGRLIDGLYLHPRDQKVLIADLIRRFGIGSSVYIFENKHLGQGTNQILINQAWNWPVLAANLESYLKTARPELEQIIADSTNLRDQEARAKLRLQAKKLVFTYGQILVGDPNLPIEFVPIKNPYLEGQQFYQEIRRYCYL